MAQATLDTANVFVFNQLLSNIVVNMQSLPRSSESAEQRPISERTRSQRRRSAETNEQTVARMSARRDRDSQRRRSGDCFDVALTDIDSTSCETFTYCTLHTSKRLVIINCL